MHECPIQDSLLKEKLLRLTPKPFHSFIHGKDLFNTKGVKIFAVNIEDSVAFVTLFPSQRMAELNFISANPFTFSSLIEHLEEELKKRNTLLLFYRFETLDPFFETILLKRGWKEKQPHFSHLLFDGFTFLPPWIQKPPSIPRGFEIFPWEELSSEERAHLKHQEKQGHFSLSLSPFRKEEKIEKINSLGLRFQGKVVGWMITHRLDANTISYASLYVELFLRKKKIPIILLITSIWKQKQSPVQWAHLEVDLTAIPSTWYYFIKRRLIPFANSKTLLFQMWTTLG